MFINSGKCNNKMENDKREGRKNNNNKSKSQITNTENKLKMLYK